MTPPSRNGLSTIEEVIADAKAGKLFILVDDEDRENEGDLCVIGEYAEADAINFMAKYGRGLICLALTRLRTEQLGLTMMERRNESRHETAFTISIEAREGVTTGISAADRALTIKTAIDPNCGERDITTPGHIFPLIARDGGTLVRAGHTEAVVDIARACGSENPSGVICEIMKDDGEMARLPDLIGFAKEHGLKIASIADLIAWRRRNESLVQRTVESAITTRIGGDWRMIIYANTVSNIEHIALVKGDISAGEPVMVRMHALDLMADLLGAVSEKRAGDELASAMAAIAEAGRGVVVVLRESIAASLSSMVSQKLNLSNEASNNRELRDYGVGAQILTDLGIRKMILLSDTRPNVVSLEGYDLEITDWQRIHQEQA
ncbi:MAG: 3,4-dihydroxy-2-butanone-4-phosphate synthase [Proteobacteria bacterium]|jgi:3,4-dihydroxy 2-butanone 4-phosphate synthase/GTP cyclohydrolase II|nr:3,4-dihydroxy-2-butanone-4-phosphate synthase [Pseudomonadota bacterium]MDA0960256.1 3,4-dihydroxy-2-butanone-4-phosphate synthase [Pseudomonadota bacterium]MDA1152065.1 3,4-dihydroxy-2-butanone-4-phosphate synthase [Pseudomonadota bacterium]NBP48478.1 3,4-dihydroxy-2-butanone-4-phosphate synthase [Alphaproteobacteria bacterium]